MSSKLTKLLMGGAILAAMPATSAFAAGTEAGTAVTNTFSLSFTVGGDTQTVTPDADDTATFAVDRVVNLTAATTTPAVNANPGDTTVTQTFTVTNTGNSVQAYDLDFFQQADGTAPENFDTTITSVAYEIDFDGDGTVDSTGTYTFDNGQLVATPDVGPDGVITLTVTSSVPAGQADGSEATIALEANTLEPANRPTNGIDNTPIGGASGSEVVGSTDPNTDSGVETILVDGIGNGDGVTGVTDADGDGDHSVRSVVTVESAQVAANKTGELVSQDGSGCTLANPAVPLATTTGAFIPGACVQYVIEVTNSGTATANGVTIGDELQTDLVFVAAGPDTALGGNFTGTNGSIPAANQQCTSSNVCQVTLVDGELTSGETGRLIILARIK